MQTEQLEQVPVKTKKKYKRIDMSFMSMRLPNGLPRFAILPYLNYQNGQVSIISQWVKSRDGRTPITDHSSQNPKWVPHFERGWNLRGRFFSCMVLDNSWRMDMNLVQNLLMNAGLIPTKAELDKFPEPEMLLSFVPGGHWGGDDQQFFKAEPSSAVPQEIREVNWLAKGYENLRVAWEATWQAIQLKGNRPADNPLDPILIGTKDGKEWILATWDLTKLESYVCSEFVEDEE